MENKRHIKVILPLKLGWEPFYTLPQGVEARVGDRALVPFAGRSYLGVVSELDAVPSADIKNIREIYGLQEHKDKILQSEIDFWRSIARYYMCSVGEVYKAAYPSVKDETVRSKKKEQAFVECAAAVPWMAEKERQRCSKAMEMLSAVHKPLLLEGGNDEDVLLELCLNCLAKGKSVLWLVPELQLTEVLETKFASVLGSFLLNWGSNITPARKRKVAAAVRTMEKYVVLGTRSALFLPHRNLGLVIVSQEHDSSYKQTSPAPRYNGRDAAVILASQCGSDVVLSSHSPSFESTLNVLGGKYSCLKDDAAARVEWEIVDTRAEMFKNGMKGLLSVKLLDALRRFQPNSVIFKPRRSSFPKMEELSADVARYCDPRPLMTEDTVQLPIPPSTQVLAVIGADSMLGRQDFRADERLVQTVRQACAQCAGSLKKVVIQTKEAAHPVFSALTGGDTSALLSERKEFFYPPFSRIVDIVFHDEYADRQARMAQLLFQHLQELRVCNIMPLPGYGMRLTMEKDRHLALRKERLAAVVADFEKQNKYVGHIYFDVDPQ